MEQAPPCIKIIVVEPWPGVRSTGSVTFHSNFFMISSNQGFLGQMLNVPGSTDLQKAPGLAPSSKKFIYGQMNGVSGSIFEPREVSNVMFMPMCNRACCSSIDPCCSMKNALKHFARDLTSSGVAL